MVSVSVTLGDHISGFQGRIIFPNHISKKKCSIESWLLLNMNVNGKSFAVYQMVLFIMTLCAL